MANNHTYYVGENTVGVHNNGGCAGNGGTGSSVTVDYNGQKRVVYRGGKDFTVKKPDIRIDSKTGNVRTTHGVSLDVNPENVSKFGGAYRIDSLPKGLKIIQRGLRPEHFEIVPEYEMPLKMFQNLLNQIDILGPF